MSLRPGQHPEPTRPRGVDKNSDVPSVLGLRGAQGAAPGLGIHNDETMQPWRLPSLQQAGKNWTPWVYCADPARHPRLELRCTEGSPTQGTRKGPAGLVSEPRKPSAGAGWVQLPGGGGGWNAGKGSGEAPPLTHASPGERLSFLRLSESRTYIR